MAWIKEAMAAIKQSVEAGWGDFDRMQVDSELKILRKLPEFQALGKTASSELPNE